MTSSPSTTSGIECGNSFGEGHRADVDLALEELLDAINDEDLDAIRKGSTRAATQGQLKPLGVPPAAPTRSFDGTPRRVSPSSRPIRAV